MSEQLIMIEVSEHLAFIKSRFNLNCFLEILFFSGFVPVRNVGKFLSSLRNCVA